MKIINHTSIRFAMLLWVGLLLSVAANVNAAAQESGASSSTAASVAQQATSSSSVLTGTADTVAVSSELDPEPIDEDSDDDDRSELVSIGGNSSLATGERAHTVVSILGSSTSNGEVSKEVVSILGNTRVTGPVGGSAVAVLGNTYVNSKVDKDVVAVMGNVELGPQAVVNGQVVAVGGTVIRDPAAIVRGGVQNVGKSLKLGGFGWLKPWIDNCLLYGRPLALVPGLAWAWILTLVSLLSYVLTAWMMPRAVDRCVTILEEHPGHSLLAALLATIATPILIVLLCITIIGILAIPFVAIGLLSLGFFGKLVMLAWLGRRVTHSFSNGLLAHAAITTLVGGLIVTALYLVPVLGFVVYKLLGFVGFGVVVYALILNFRDKRQQGNPAVASSANHAEFVASTAQASARVDAASADTAQLAADSTTDEAVKREADTVVNAASLPRASFWIRMAALAVDVVLVSIISNVLNFNVFNFGGVLEHSLLLSLATYGALMWKLKGTTIGGIVFHLRVVRVDGGELDWATAIVRALSCFLSLVVAGLGFIWILFDDDKQAWHDKIAGTVVVRTPKGVSLV